MEIGTDITKIDRITAAIERFGERFLDRYLNKSEQELAKSDASFAGYWAAKEAVAKALGCGIGKELGFRDIILAKSPQGKPTFTLSQLASQTFDIRSASLSISHDGGFAIAVVAIELNK